MKGKKEVENQKRTIFEGIEEERGHVWLCFF